MARTPSRPVVVVGATRLGVRARGPARANATTMAVDAIAARRTDGETAQVAVRKVSPEVRARETATFVAATTSTHAGC